MCWHPNGDRFGSKSLGVVAWGKGRGVAGEGQCRGGQPLLAVDCVCKSIVVE